MRGRCAWGSRLRVPAMLATIHNMGCVADTLIQRSLKVAT